MIKAVEKRDGTQVTIELDPADYVELFEEFTAIIKAVHERIKEDTHNDTIADALVAGAGRMAFAVTDEEHQAVIKDLVEVLDSESEKMFGFRLGDIE